MPRRIRRHLSFANVTSLAALVFAMAGTGYALTIPKNSVGTKQIKKNGVAGSEIKKNAVRTGEVKNGSLLAADFKLGQLPAGAKGAPGIQGSPGTAGAITVERKDYTVGASISTGNDVTCPAGTKAIGGGGSINGAATDIAMISSAPWVDDSGGTAADGGPFDSWRVVFSNPDLTGTSPASIFVVCAQG